jgi:hypothetical protein
MEVGLRLRDAFLGGSARSVDIFAAAAALVQSAASGYNFTGFGFYKPAALKTGAE